MISVIPAGGGRAQQYGVNGARAYEIGSLEDVWNGESDIVQVGDLQQPMLVQT